METYQQQKYKDAGVNAVFVQDNLSKSKKGTLRGLHFQHPPLDQGKLVYVLHGSVFDVAVDIRSGSPTFGRWVSAQLDTHNKNQLWIPAGFAHGFVALEDDTVFAYKCTNVYSPHHDAGVLWNDPDIGIKWPLAESQMSLSPKDLSQPKLTDVKSPFIYSIQL